MRDSFKTTLVASFSSSRNRSMRKTSSLLSEDMIGPPIHSDSQSPRWSKPSQTSTWCEICRREQIGRFQKLALSAHLCTSVCTCELISLSLPIFKSKAGFGYIDPFVSSRRLLASESVRQQGRCLLSNSCNVVLCYVWGDWSLWFSPKEISYRSSQSIEPYEGGVLTSLINITFSI